jgi:hypothetical protein
MRLLARVRQTGFHIPGSQNRSSWGAGSAVFLLALCALALCEGCGSNAPRIGIINTVAGSGNPPFPGFSGDGGLASNALLNNPSGVAVDTAGNFYIADTLNHVIRMVNTGGTISTVVGSETPTQCPAPTQSCGDGGPAINAQLNSPGRVALDEAGNLYITDLGDNRVRMVNTSGQISTVAGTGVQGYSGDGGPATSAQLSDPTGLAVTSAGDLYISDPNDSVVRKVTAATGIITTVAGNGSPGYSGDGGAATSAQLNNPSGLAVDSSGNLYIADAGNARIRKVDASSGDISTVAGDGVPGYSGDGGVATSAELNDPAGVAFDAKGDLYIAEEGNARIRWVRASDKAIYTIAGDGTTGFYGDLGPATGAELNNPVSVALNSGGYLFIADRGNNRIRQVAPAK